MRIWHDHKIIDDLTATKLTVQLAGEFYGATLPANTHPEDLLVIDPTQSPRVVVRRHPHTTWHVVGLATEVQCGFVTPDPGCTNCLKPSRG